MNRIRKWSLVLGSVLLAGGVLADAGVCRARVVRDPWVISVFTPALVSSASPTEFRVRVQRQDTGAGIPEVRVQLRLDPPPGAHIRPEEAYCGWGDDLAVEAGAGSPGWPRTVVLRAGGVPGEGAHGARLRLPAAGPWKVTVTAFHGATNMMTAMTLPVQAPWARLLAVWPSLLLPPLAILGFVVRERLRRRPFGKDEG